MKQETKRVIDWIKEKALCPVGFRDRQFLQISCMELDKFNENREKALILIDSVTELENNLTKGGIIQDSKGNLCKDGDKINLIVHHIDGGEHKEVYTLRWSEKFRHFNLVNNYNIIALEDNDFEKVE